MTCSVCKREDMSDDCGPTTNGEPCRCCGIEIIVTARSRSAEDDVPSSTSTPQENSHNEV